MSHFYFNTMQMCCVTMILCSTMFHALGLNMRMGASPIVGVSGSLFLAAKNILYNP